MFWLRNKKIIFSYALLSGGLIYINSFQLNQLTTQSLNFDPVEFLLAIFSCRSGLSNACACGRGNNSLHAG